MTRPRCIVCDKAIQRATRALYLRSEEQAARNIGGPEWLTVPVLPRTKEECQRLTNQRVMRVDGFYEGVISVVTTWDGTSYVSPYFCSQKCTVKQGLASAQHGARFNWKGLT